MRASRWLVWLGRLVLSLCAGIAVYLVLAAGLALHQVGPLPPENERSHRILLLPGPIHVDFLLPLDPDLQDRFGWTGQDGVPLWDPRARWLVVGWGARDFYTNTGTYADPQLAPTVKAIMGDASVLRLDVLGILPDSVTSWPVDLNASQYAALLSGIEQTFDQGPGTLPLPEQGLTRTDVFYPAKGRFNIFRTCNVWIGEQLRAAGVRFGAWTPTRFAVRLAWSRAP